MNAFPFEVICDVCAEYLRRERARLDRERKELEESR